MIEIKKIELYLFIALFNLILVENCLGQNKFLDVGTIKSINAYAIPITSSSRIPIDKKMIKSYFEEYVQIKESEKFEFISKRIAGLDLEGEFLQKETNVRVYCKVKGSKKNLKIYFHKGGTVEINESKYTFDEELVQSIMEYFPEGFGLP